MWEDVLTVLLDEREFGLAETVLLLRVGWRLLESCTCHDLAFGEAINKAVERRQARISLLKHGLHRLSDAF